MIPKKLHLCWLSGENYPPAIVGCIESRVKTLPDYETRLWTARDARSLGCRYIDQALDRRQWKAAAGALSFYALMSEGGVFMDCDVKIVSRFDRLVPDRGFEAFIDSRPDGGVSLHHSVMIGEKGNRFCREIFDYYLNRPFVRLDGTVDPAGPAQVLTRHASANGFRAEDTEQLLDNETVILPGCFVTARDTTPQKSKTFAVVTGIDYNFNENTRPTPARRIADRLSETFCRIRRLFHPIQLPPCK